MSLNGSSSGEACANHDMVQHRRPATLKLGQKSIQQSQHGLSIPSRILPSSPLLPLTASMSTLASPQLRRSWGRQNIPRPSSANPPPRDLYERDTCANPAVERRGTRGRRRARLRMPLLLDTLRHARLDAVQRRALLRIPLMPWTAHVKHSRQPSPGAAERCMAGSAARRRRRAVESIRSQPGATITGGRTGGAFSGRLLGGGACARFRLGGSGESDIAHGHDHAARFACPWEGRRSLRIVLLRWLKRNERAWDAARCRVRARSADETSA